MSLDQSAIRDAIHAGITEGLSEFPEQFQIEDHAALLRAANEAAAYAVAAAAGDPQAVQNMAHLRVQAALLAAKTTVRSTQHAQAILETVLVTAARVASIVLKA